MTVLHLFNADPTADVEIRSTISANSPFLRFLRILVPPAGYLWFSRLYLTMLREAFFAYYLICVHGTIYEYI